jgi:hypothetical protein
MGARTTEPEAEQLADDVCVASREVHLAQPGVDALPGGAHTPAVTRRPRRSARSRARRRHGRCDSHVIAPSTECRFSQHFPDSPAEGRLSRRTRAWASRLRGYLGEPLGLVAARAEHEEPLVPRDRRGFGHEPVLPSAALRGRRRRAAAARAAAG